MKIAVLSPLWEPVPPKTYGGIELVVKLLCDGLVKRGHEVTLFASGDSETLAELKSIIPISMREANYEVPQFYEACEVSQILECEQEFDVIHNHLGYLVFPFLNLFETPIVTTLHGAFCRNEEISIYKKVKNHPFVSISNSQRLPIMDLNYIDTVYNGIDVKSYTFEATPDLKDPYLAFLGRVSEEKGTHLAIQLALETNQKLLIAGKIGSHDIEYYETKVKPLIDGKQIQYVGEMNHAQKNVFMKNARAVIHCVTWPEPFGLVMAESMACGTPVLALNDGSIPEVICNKKTGFIENNIEDLIKHVKNIDTIDRYACRKWVEENFTAEQMIDNYLKVYNQVMTTQKSPNRA